MGLASFCLGPTERLPPGTGRHAEGATEMVAQRHRRAEPGQRGDRLHALLAALQQALTQGQALGQQPVAQRGPVSWRKCRVKVRRLISAPLYSNAMGSATAEEIQRVFTAVMHTGFAAVLSTDDWLNALQTGEVPQAHNIYLSNQRAIAGR
jgi:hypothetical protein